MATEATLLVGTAATKDGGSGGLFRRQAGGAWQHVFSAADVHAITPHPTEADTVFLGSKDGPYVSTDRGARWERVGFPDRGVQVWSTRPIRASSMPARRRWGSIAAPTVGRISSACPIPGCRIGCAWTSLAGSCASPRTPRAPASSTPPWK